MKKESVFGLATILFLLGLGVFQMPKVFDPVLAPRTLYVGVAALLALASTYKTWGKTTIPLAMWAWPLLLGWGFVSAQGALNPAEAWYTLARIGICTAFLFGFTALWQAGAIRGAHIAKGLLVLGGVTTLWALSEFRGEEGFWTNIYEVKAGFWHKNVLSGALFLMLAGVLAFRDELEGYWAKAALILIPTWVGLLFLLRTRGAWVALAVGGLLALLLWLRNRKAQGGKSLKYLWISLALGGAVLVGGLASSEGLAAASDASNLKNRVHFWKSSLEMIQTSPVTGVGPGNWKIHFPQYGLRGLDATVNEGERLTVRPHNDYLWVATEFGLPGLLLFLAFWGWALWFAIKSSLENPTSNRFMWLAAGIAAYLAFSMTDFPLERPDLQVLALMLAAVALTSRKGSAWSPKGGMAVVLGIGLVSVWAMKTRIDGETAYVKVYEANARIQPQVLLRAVPEATNSMFNMDMFGNPLIFFSGKSHLALNQYPLAKQDFEAALELNPWHIQTLFQMGNLLRQEGKKEEALARYDQAIAIAPTFQDGNLNACRIRLEMGDTARALTHFVRLRTNFENPYYREAFARLVPRITTYSGTFDRRGEVIRGQMPATQNPDELAKVWESIRQESVVLANQ